MIVLVLTRDQAQHIYERVTNNVLVELLGQILQSHDRLPEPDDLLPAALSLRHDGIIAVTFADKSLADIVWDGLSAEKRVKKSG